MCSAAATCLFATESSPSRIAVSKLVSANPRSAVFSAMYERYNQSTGSFGWRCNICSTSAKPAAY